jgi:hypothetical protein
LDGRWDSWNFGEVPPQLIEEANHLLQKISGSAPVHLSKKDDRSWGKEGYTVKLGYKQLEDSDIPPKLTIWKEIWNSNNLPKINIFCWQLAHNKILTRGNLIKRVFLGPFRCALWNSSREISDHLFLHCSFTKQVMNSVYKELASFVAKPTNTRSLIGKWAKQYKGKLQGKQYFNRVWKASIKFVCWQIWIARNKRIFKEKIIPPQAVASNIIAQLSDFLSCKKKLTMATDSTRT